jgi:hypothetical protein
MFSSEVLAPGKFSHSRLNLSSSLAHSFSVDNISARNFPEREEREREKERERERKREREREREKRRAHEREREREREREQERESARRRHLCEELA